MKTLTENPLRNGNSTGDGTDVRVITNASNTLRISQNHAEINAAFDIKMLQGVKGGNGKYTARCPAHDDRVNSLSVSVLSDKTLLYCHAGCSTDNILAALGLPMSALFSDKQPPSKQSVTPLKPPAILSSTSPSKPFEAHLEPSETLMPLCSSEKPSTKRQQTNNIIYDYNNPDGTLAYRKNRYEYSDGTKTFAFFKPNGSKGVSGVRRVPYNLPAVLKAETVYFVEGEKAADAVIRAGRTATSLDAGAKSKWLPEYNEYFKDKAVFILPDNDAPGLSYARSIAAQLRGSRIIELPGLESKGDIYDWLDAGHAIDELDGFPGEKWEEEDKPPEAIKPIQYEGAVYFNPFETPQTKRRYAMNDIGAGNFFADVYKNISRFVLEADMWYVYDGRAWRPDVGSVIVSKQAKDLTDYMLDCRKFIDGDSERETWVRFVLSRMKRHARDTMLIDARSVYPLHIAEFDKDPYIFNCQNCTLDLRTLNVHKHNPDDLLSKISNVRYDPAAQCARWEQFISEIMRGDEETSGFLQKALGYALTGDTSEECFFILYGSTTRNGKGTTMETTLRMLGDYGRTAQPETIAQKQSTHNGGPSEDIARLKGARFVNMSEPEKGLRLNSALVKQMTGGDTITARFLHQNSFEFRPEYKLFINTNHLPKIGDDSIFASGRVKLIPFERHFPEDQQDKGLKAFFKRPENISGIFNWFIEGLAIMQVEGLEQPKSVKDATDQYREESDTVGLFIRECLVEAKGLKTPLKDIYAEYSRWCEEYGYSALNKNNLTTELRRKGMEVKNATGNKVCLYGYGIICIDDIPEEWLK